MDPQPFVSYLNDYIDDLQDRIETLKFGSKPDKELNIGNLAKVLEQYHVKYPRIVIAQALLETGYFTSRVCWECKNLFGLRRPSDGSYYELNGGRTALKPTGTTYNISIKEGTISSSSTVSAMPRISITS